MKKLVFTVLLFTTFLLTGCSNDSSFKVERVDVRAQILSDGDLYIEELFTYNFQGEYDYTERSLELLGHEGVEFFEAYIPPAAKALGEFSYENAKRLDVDYSNKQSAYYTKVDAKDETKKIYYRYRLDQAASRFHDTAELDWNFFCSNDSDLHNLTIETFLPSAFNRSDVAMFAHNRHGGEFTDVNDYSIVYKSDFVS
ncbi:MAG TPA: DUF2207 domain-containing protein, partial [Bacillus sp. (in: firmicutes)]|nr:DUF2207 domain-containing protein [Bacillus sp. (in: firmicutes)]